MTSRVATGIAAGFESPLGSGYCRLEPAYFSGLIQMTINEFGDDLHAGSAVRVWPTGWPPRTCRPGLPWMKKRPGFACFRWAFLTPLRSGRKHARRKVPGGSCTDHLDTSWCIWYAIVVISSHPGQCLVQISRKAAETNLLYFGRLNNESKS